MNLYCGISYTDKKIYFATFSPMDYKLYDLSLSFDGNKQLLGDLNFNVGGGTLDIAGKRVVKGCAYCTFSSTRAVLDYFTTDLSMIIKFRKHDKSPLF